ncbi:hypothetical protein NL676_010046 [Syzygium grande]|nr:hypothetical protein NL676_010046 [Syzygium grande]
MNRGEGGLEEDEVEEEKKGLVGNACESQPNSPPWSPKSILKATTSAITLSRVITFQTSLVFSPTPPSSPRLVLLSLFSPLPPTDFLCFDVTREQMGLAVESWNLPSAPTPPEKSSFGSYRTDTVAAVVVAADYYPHLVPCGPRSSSSSS